jgi:transposase InsO family protein
VGPLKKAKGGFEYIFVAIDKFIKWIEYKPLIKYSAAKAVEFIQDIMHHFGIPNRIIIDLGSPFTAIEFRNWAQNCGISINYASVTHPEANEHVERVTRYSSFFLVYGSEAVLLTDLIWTSPKIEQYKEGEAE